MSGTASVRPHGTRSVEADETGLRITLPWGGWVITTLMLLGVPAGFVGVRYVTCEQLETAIAQSEAKQEKPVRALQTKVGALTSTIGEVQKTQHMDIASREARRVVDERINCKRGDSDCLDKRDTSIERIRKLNMRRLANQQEPCLTLECK